MDGQEKTSQLANHESGRGEVIDGSAGRVETAAPGVRERGGDQEGAEPSRRGHGGLDGSGSKAAPKGEGETGGEERLTDNYRIRNSKDPASYRPAKEEGPQRAQTRRRRGRRPCQGRGRAEMGQARTVRGVMTKRTNEFLTSRQSRVHSCLRSLRASAARESLSSVSLGCSSSNGRSSRQK